MSQLGGGKPQGGGSHGSGGGGGGLAGQLLGGLVGGGSHGSSGHGGSGGGAAGIGGKLASQLASNLFSSGSNKPSQPQNYHGGQSAHTPSSGGLAGSVVGGVSSMFGGGGKPQGSSHRKLLSREHSLSLYL